MRVLRNRTYRHLFCAQVVALVGTGLLTVALGLLAYDVAGSSAGAVLGTALTLKILAYVTLSPVIAAAAHRVPRRALLVGSDLVRAMVAIALPFVDAVWQVYLLVVVLQTASAAFTPAFQAVIPSVLPREEDYTNALSLSRLAYDMESLLSPVLAGALLTVISYNALFLGTVAGFVGSAVLVLTTTLPATAPPVSEPFRRRVSRGSRLFLAVPQLRALLALDLAVASATAVVLVNTVVIVRDGLGRGNVDVAVALAAYGLGSMVVALALPAALRRTTDRAVMLPAAALLVAGLLASAVVARSAAGWAPLLGVWLVLGMGCSLVLTPSARLLRRHSSEEDRPAVFAAQFSLSHACYLLTYPVAGWLGAAAGPAAASVVLAAAALTGGVLAAVSWRSEVSPPRPTPARAG